MLFANATNEAVGNLVKNPHEFTVNLDPSALTSFGPLLAIVALAVVAFFKLRQKEGGTKFFGVLLAASLASLGGYGVSRFHASKEFDSRASDYIVAAYNAKTPEEAKLQFDRAVKYLREEGMTQGTTAYLYPSPQYDVGDWYKRIEAAETRINSINSKAQPDLAKVLVNLEQNPANAAKILTNAVQEQDLNYADNVVSKPWQKALVDTEVVSLSKDSQPEFTAPEGISTHPSSKKYAAWLWSSVLAVLLNLCAFVYKTRKQW